MTYLASLYILVINFLSSITRKETLILYSSLLLMILLFGGIYDCADDGLYRYMYDYISRHGYTVFQRAELGYNVFVFLCTKIGLNYLAFRTLIAFIGLYLMFRVAREFSANFNLTFLLYFIFPFMLDVIQYRNFLSSAIVIYSMKYLIKEYNKANMKYLIVILIAFSIHYMAIFFLPFLIVKKYSVKSIARNALYITPVLCVLTSTQIIPNLVQMFVSPRLAEYVATYFQRAHWGFLLMWARQISISGIALLCYLFLKNRDIEDKWKDFNTFVIKLNIYLIIVCFPLLMFNGNFFRLLRPMMFLDYILIGQVILYKTKNTLLYTGLALIIALSFFYMDVLNPNNIKSVLIPFFTKNHYFYLTF